MNCDNSLGTTPVDGRNFASVLAELKRPEAVSLLAKLLKIARSGNLTLVYGAKDQEHNQAVMLKELLDKKLRRS